MAIAITDELRDSRVWRETATEKTLERLFHITGTDDPADASAFGPQIGEFWDDELRVVERAFTPIMPENSGPDDGRMELNVLYRWRYVQETGAAPEFELDIGTESEHVFVTPRKYTIDNVVYPRLEQRHAGADGLDEEPGNFINVNDDKVAEGVDALVPRIQLREDHERTTLPIAYQKTLVRLTGKVNKSAWRGWAAKTILFLGATARKRKGESWRVSYTFLAGYHATISLEALDGTTTITKEAHDYLWFRRVESESGGVSIDSSIQDVHVAPLYHEANFADLGIGTGALS